MKKQTALLRMLFLGSAMVASTFVMAQEPATPPADNTKTNQQDRSKSQPTADQQKENANDRALAQQIRRAIVKDKSLSTDAHNIKVIAQGGQITLKGPVRSEGEKHAIEAKAQEIAGAGNITSQLQVATK